MMKNNFQPTYEYVKQVAIETVSKMPQFKYPQVNGIGITKVDEKLAICVNFVDKKPKDVELPEIISGVKIVYRFELGNITAQ